MQKNRYFPMTVIAVAILSGCNSVPPKNPTLADAHSSYDSARANPLVTNLAALELKEAGDSLNKADVALSKGESDATVNQLAYIARQQVAIAQETSKRKSAELAVANAGAKRDQIRLEARTAEADAAKQQVAIVQETADQQAAASRVNAQRAQNRINAAEADTRAAEQQVEFVSEIADAQAAALETADANAQRDKQIIALQEIELKELNARKGDRGMVITLGDVLFSTNKAQLQSGGMRNLQKLADFLKLYPRQKVLIEGFTDSTGSDGHNQELSDQRAHAVRMALIDMGIGGDRVTARGYGEAFPVGSNKTAAGRQLNRRVEIIISDGKGNIAPR